MSRIRKFLAALYHAFFNFVLNSFKSINRKIRSKLPVWRMKEETKEHVQSSIKVFRWIILPASLLYVFLEFYLFGENALDTMLWGLAVFFNSNFLPDLPSIYRKKPKTMMRKTFHGISATPYYCLRRCSYGFYFQVYA
jgi:hypothetical protein